MAFTTAFRDAERLFPRLAENGAAMQVIQGAASPEHQRDQDLFGQIQAARGRMLGEARLTVIAQHVDPPELHDRLENALVTALGELGVTAGTGSSCQSGMVFSTTATLECHAGHFGPVCITRANALLRDCATEREIAPVELGEVSRGAHPRSQESAAADALRKITPAVLLPALRQQLSAILPVR
jgi:hypothetical protein